jgi:3-deoxy-D-arabino-heptulosonate 7-phosphate (DAHP) synthase
MDNQLTSIDLVSILSFFLGYQNLLENRQQSAHNDVQAANDAQAQFLLEKLSAQFSAQNKMLEEILAILRGGEKVGN